MNRVIRLKSLCWNKLLSNEKINELIKREDVTLEIYEFFEDMKKINKRKNLINEACHLNNLKLVKYLTEIGYKDNEIYGGILSTCMNNNLDMLKYLYETSEQLFKKDIYYTRYASEKGRLDMIKYLHKKKCKFNCDSIVNAALNNHFEVVKYLTEEVKIACLCKDIMHDLLQYDNVELFRYLVEKFKVEFGNDCIMYCAKMTKAKKIYNYLHDELKMECSCFDCDNSFTIFTINN